MELAKAKYYSDTKSSKEIIYKQMVSDKQKFDKRNKVFFFINGGCTYSELIAAERNSIKPGCIGLFNRGNQIGDREFFVISDFVANPHQFFNKFLSE